MHVVCPRDGGGHSWTLHRNYLFPISNTLEQVEDENSAVGVEPIDMSTPVPPVDAGLLANEPIRSQPESLPNPPPKKHELIEPE